MDKLNIIRYIMNTFHSQIAIDVIKMVMDNDTTLGLISDYQLYFNNHNRDQYHGDTLNHFMNVLGMYEDYYQKEKPVILSEDKANLVNSIPDVSTGSLLAVLSIAHSYGHDNKEIIPLIRIKPTGAIIADLPEYEIKVYRKID